MKALEIVTKLVTVLENNHVGAVVLLALAALTALAVLGRRRPPGN